jgi:hypothetical protein
MQLSKLSIDSAHTLEVLSPKLGKLDEQAELASAAGTPMSIDLDTSRKASVLMEDLDLTRISPNEMKALGERLASSDLISFDDSSFFATMPVGTTIEETEQLRATPRNTIALLQDVINYRSSHEDPSARFGLVEQKRLLNILESLNSLAKG